jgi:hypothetical protein
VLASPVSPEPTGRTTPAGKDKVADTVPGGLRTLASVDEDT